MVSAKTAPPTVIESHAQPGAPESRIYVIFTDAARTKTALQAAARLARGLDLPLELLTAQVVPYPLPLSEPPVSVEFIGGAMARLVGELEAEISVRILLCRDRDRTIRDAVAPDALVIIGGRRPRLARLLKSDGRRVIVIH